MRCSVKQRPWQRCKIKTLWAKNSSYHFFVQLRQLQTWVGLKPSGNGFLGGLTWFKVQWDNLLTTRSKATCMRHQLERPTEEAHLFIHFMFVDLSLSFARRHQHPSALLELVPLFHGMETAVHPYRITWGSYTVSWHRIIFTLQEITTVGFRPRLQKQLQGICRSFQQLFPCATCRGGTSAGTEVVTSCRWSSQWTDLL